MGIERALEHVPSPALRMAAQEALDAACEAIELAKAAKAQRRKQTVPPASNATGIGNSQLLNTKYMARG